MYRLYSLLFLIQALTFSYGFGMLYLDCLEYAYQVFAIFSFSQSFISLTPTFSSILLTTTAPVTTSRAVFPTSQTTTTTSSRLFAEDEQSYSRQSERGVSVDQDGKSNVWAIEPKMEVSTKSSEEKTQSALIAGGGLIAFAAVAGVVLTNLPDPNQF
jgi:hypothetical protein